MTDTHPASSDDNQHSLPNPDPDENVPAHAQTLEFEPAAAHVAAPPREARRRSTGGVLGGLAILGLLLLAAVGVWGWYNPRPVVDEDAARIQTLSDRIAALENRPPPAPQPDLRPLEQRVYALEKRPVAAPVAPAPAPPPPVDLGPLEARIAALENKPAPEMPPVPPPPDLTPIEKRLSEQEAAQDKLVGTVAGLATRADVTALAARADAIAGRQDQVAGDLSKLQQSFTARIEADEGRAGEAGRTASQALDQAQVLAKQVGTLQQSAGQLPALADRAARLARVQSAQAALEAGQKLGAMPGAPPELTRFADTAPPTVASLRLAFPAVAQAAEEAASPEPASAGFVERAWARAQSLVTVRQGETVVVGNPAAGVLARARMALDAGDLAGAVAGVGSLSGPPAAAMAGWLDQARSLLAARSALAEMAAHA